MTLHDLLEQMMYKEKYKHIIGKYQEETQEDQEEEEEEDNNIQQETNITNEELQEILQQITETITSNEDIKIIQEHEKIGIPPSVTALTLATNYQTKHIILTKYITELQDIASTYKEKSKQLIQESITLTTIEKE